MNIADFAENDELFRASWLSAWSMQTIRQIERGERDQHLEEDLTFEDLGVRRAAKERLEILRGLEILKGLK